MTTPQSMREEIAKFYSGGKALAKGEVVVTYKDHLKAVAAAREEERDRIRQWAVTHDWDELDVDGHHSYDRARQREGLHRAQEELLAFLTPTDYPANNTQV